MSSILSTIFDSASVALDSFAVTWSRIAQFLRHMGPRERGPGLSESREQHSAPKRHFCDHRMVMARVSGARVVLAAATIAFLVGTALWTTMQASTQVDWKNEALPLLFCGIGGKGSSMSCAVGEIKGVHGQAKGIQVQLEKGANGWRFVEMSGSARR